MVRFGDFEIDDAARELRRDGEVVHLEPQAFDVLAHLIHNRARVVPKQELLDSVWGHRFVSESALTTRIKEARRAVGDDGARQDVITNVRGRGYRFVAALAEDGTSLPSEQGRSRTTQLVGRAPDVDGVLERLGPAGLVSIVGPGGVGKTTLATEVARRWRESSGHSVRTVALGELTAPGSVVAALAEATGIMADGNDATRVVAALAGRSELLVLDNCEHLVSEVAAVVAELLDAAPDLAMLATSRERLGLAAEHVWPLHPLAGEEARRLFLQRAEATGTAVAVDTDVVDRVVGALDGLPLAIEMAAAQMAAMGAADLEALVQQRIDLLRSPSRAAPPRHRTLDALVRWSLDLLEPTDRRLLAELGVFAGPTTAPDAAVVLGDPTGASDAPAEQLEIAAGLATLCGRSLLTADPSRTPTRYRVPEVVRSVAALEVADGPGSRRAVLATRHARHHLDVAQEADRALRGPGERDAHERITEAIAELRVAHVWGCEHDPDLVTDMAAALHLFAYSRLWGEPASWARRTGAPRDAVQAAIAAADAANRSRLAEAADLARAASTSDDPRASAIGLEVLSDVALYRGELDESARHSDQIRRLGIDTGDLHLQAIGLVNLALSAAYGGRHDRAAQVVAEMHALAPELAPSDQAWCLYVAGEVAAAEDPAGALEPLRSAIATAESVGNRLLPCVARTTLASSLTRLGEITAALDEFATCVEEAIAYGNSTHAATILRNLVDLLVAAGDTRTAAVLLGALGADDVKTTYGDEARRMEATRDALTGGRATTDVDAWMAEGVALRMEEALRVALTAVEALRS
jgi:predicted ATPase/DNA-binding winged helix-turn-helix (wHTH) protein